VKIPSAKNAAIALHLVAEAQKLLEKVETRFSLEVLPGLLRELADRIDKEHENSNSPTH